MNTLSVNDDPTDSPKKPPVTPAITPPPVQPPPPTQQGGMAENKPTTSQGPASQLGQQSGGQKPGDQPVTPPPAPQPPPPPPPIGPAGETLARPIAPGGGDPVPRGGPLTTLPPGGISFGGGDPVLRVGGIAPPPPSGPAIPFNGGDPILIQHPPVGMIAPPPGGNPPPGNAPPPVVAPPPGNQLNLNDPSGNGLQTFLQGQVNNPSPMGSAPWQQAYTQGYQNLQDQARLAGANAQADAAKRGVFYGSPLTTSLGDISTQLQRGAGDLQSNLLLNYAQTLGQNQQNAIGNIFNYGQQQNQADQFQARLGLDEANSGFAGAPNIDYTLGQTLGIGQPGYTPGSPPDLSGFGALAGYLAPGSQPGQYGNSQTVGGITSPDTGTSAQTNMNQIAAYNQYLKKVQGGTQ